MPPGSVRFRRGTFRRDRAASPGAPARGRTLLVVSSVATRNRWTFAVGTVGRDMVYILVSLYLVYYLTEAVDVSDGVLAWVTGLTLAARLFDAVMDIVMGGVVDNTRSRWGAYKPWILGGALASGVLTVCLFTDLSLSDTGYVVFFAVVYLLWGLAWTSNDIPYWSLLPSLTLDSRERERVSALTKIFATIGTALAVVLVIPVTTALTAAFGRTGAWTAFAAAAVVIMWLGQAATLVGVKEPGIAVEQPKTTPRELVRAVTVNDQLLTVAITQTLFMIGYVTTTSFGTYFFKYAYGDEAMYTPFGAVLLLSQVLGFLVFPLVNRRLRRGRLYALAIGMVVLGYVAFFFAPMNMVAIAVCGLLVFVGQAWVSLLMLLFIAETVDYGHLKLGRRNQAVTFALQPFINKVGAALSTGIVSATVIASGINDARTPADVTPSGLLLLRISMLALPCALIVIGYLVYRARYRLDEAAYADVLARLRASGQLVDS